ncbi:MAG TPA: hypothetical protein VLF67_03365 [Candidatus Saccharimonas sp.]|nr:hypothetical protein [Candidatus Saccharimonas sp.]
MLTYLLYNRRTPGEGQMQTLAKRLEPEQVNVELLDADSPRGIQLAEHYDILARPAVVMVRDDGSPVQVWQDPSNLPSPSEIGYLAHS